MAPRPLLALTSLIFIGGAIVLLFLVLLAGSINSFPVSKIFFLEADTSAIAGAPALSRWTLWNACSVANGLNVVNYVTPAYPLDPPNNFGTTAGVAADFVGTNKYYLETRFMFAFYLIALFFAVCSFFLGMMAICTRLGSYVSSMTCFIALFFETITAGLMTAAYVQGRNAFLATNHYAQIGSYAFGFVWAAMVCLLIATILFGLGGSASREQSYSKGSRFGMGRKRSTRSRGSFIDTESSRRVANI